MATPNDPNIRQTAEELAFLKDAINSIGETLKDTLNARLEESDSILQRIQNNIKKETTRSIVELGRGFDGALKSQIALSQGALKQKDIQKQRNDLLAKEAAIQTALEQANLNGLIGKREKKKIEREINTQIQFQNSLLDKQEEELNRINKNLGLTGKTIQGISKIPILGNLIDSEKVLSAVQKEAAKEGSTRTKTMAAGFKAVGSSLKTGLTDPLTVGTFLLKSILNASTKITDIQKSFGINRGTARDISLEFEKQSIISGDIFITSKKLNQSFRDLSTELGFAADISGQTLETFTNLTQRLGFGNKEAAQLTYLARLQGENTETTLQNTSKTVSNLNKQKGTAINIKDVFIDIASASAATVVSLGGSVDALAEASVKARQLGLTLGQVDQIASSLLDFQTSIENELAAELMTGKQINLEQARYYALTNQTAKLTEEISNNQEIISAFASDNRLAQEAAAKALGMSREDLGKMVMQQQFLALGADAFKAKFGEANYEQMKSLSIGEKFQATLEKVQEVIGNIGYALEPLLNAFASLASSSKFVLGAVGAIAGLSLVKTIGSLAVMATQLGLISAEAVTTNAALTFGIGTVAILASLGAVMGAIQDFKKADDMISPGYGKRMLFDEGKVFALNNKDNVIATTNPILSNDIISKPAGSVRTQQSPSPQQSNQNIKVTPSTTVVQLNLNSANIGNATARSNYNITTNSTVLGMGIDASATS